jgi:hypothetical protein
MSKSVVQVLQDTVAILERLRKELAETEKRVQGLEKKVEGLLSAPASRRGVKVPQTPRPDTLQELEIGKNPKGT